jgi:hypothetical protein
MDYPFIFNVQLPSQDAIAAADKAKLAQPQAMELSVVC